MQRLLGAMAFQLRTVSVLFGFRSAFVAAALTAAAAPLAAQDPGGSSRPRFQFLRQNEDWSGFRAGADAGPLDRFKHVDLSDDGDVWIGFGGRFDTRFEAWDGFGFGATTPGNQDEFLLTRILAHADLHVGRRLRVFVEGKTAQVLGRDQLPGLRRGLDQDSLALQQAFVDYFVVPGDERGDGSLRVRVGRQMFLFGTQRFVSPLPWANTLRTWDGISAQYRTGPWSINGFASWFVPVQKRSFNDSNDDLELYGIYATRQPTDGGRGYDVYVLGNTRPNVAVNGTTGNERRRTVGLRTWGGAGRLGDGALDAEFEGAYQFGEVGNNGVTAWSVTGVLGYRPDEWRWAPRFFVGVDAASGDARTGGHVQTFHQLFPLGHAYLGLADAFGRQNIFAVQVGTQLKLAPATKLQLVAHSFRAMESADGFYNVGGARARAGQLGDRELGHEIDLLVNHKVNAHVSLYGGYSHLFAGSGIGTTGPDDDQSFFYFGAAAVF